MLISSKVGLLPFINAQFPCSSTVVVYCNFAFACVSTCMCVFMRSWTLHVIALRLTHFSAFVHICLESNTRQVDFQFWFWFFWVLIDFGIIKFKCEQHAECNVKGQKIPFSNLKIACHMSFGIEFALAHQFFIFKIKDEFYLSRSSKRSLFKGRGKLILLN